MKKKLLSLFLIVCVSVSCTDTLEQMKKAPLQKNVAQTGLVRNLNDYVSYFSAKKNATKSTNSYTMEPYVYKGDTIMYVVNYNDGGWELLSTDYRAPLVLVSSDTGAFNSGIDEHPYLNLIKNDLIKLHSTPFNSAYVDDSWKPVKLFNNEVDTKRIMRSPKAAAPQPGEDGEWVLLERTTPVLVERKCPARLITTSWNQDFPWNNYSPFLTESNKHAPAGCSAVALAQYLYYLHYKTGNPASTIDSAVYNVENNTYSYYGNSSAVWDLMAKRSNEVGTDYSAKFIGYVGKSCNAKYAKVDSIGTTIKRSAARAFLNSFGYRYYLADIDYSYVTGKLESGNAVIAFASCTEDGCGNHTYIIDGYERTVFKSTNTYGWVGKDIYGNDSNDYDDEGNIVGYAFTYEDEVTTTHLLYMMNWGYMEKDNNLKFSVGGNWKAGGHFFNAGRMIFKENN